MAELQVSGFHSNLLALNGLYRPNNAMNHGRPVYQNTSTTNQVVLMYFWDSSNGPDLYGWWLAPEVGSQQAWATGPPNNDMIPPARGWKHPWNGPVDPNVHVQCVGGMKRPLDQQDAQQQPYRGYQGNSYPSQQTQGYPDAAAQQNRGYDQQNRGYDQQNRGYDQQNRGYDQQNQQNRGYDQQNRGYDQQNRGYDQQNQQNRGYDQQNRGYDQQYRGYDQQNRGFDQQNRGYDQQNKGFDQQNRGYDQQNRGFDQQNRGFDQQNRGFDQQYQQQNRGFDQQNQQNRGFDQQNQQNQQNRGYDQQNQQNRGYDQQNQQNRGYDQQNQQNRGYDQQNRGFDQQNRGSEQQTRAYDQQNRGYDQQNRGQEQQNRGQQGRGGFEQQNRGFEQQNRNYDQQFGQNQARKGDGKGERNKYHERRNTYGSPSPPEYKTDDTALVATEKALEEVTTFLREQPVDLKKSKKSIEDAEVLCGEARKIVQGPNINPAWHTRLSKISTQFQSFRRDIEFNMRRKFSENVQKIKDMIQVTREASDKAQKDSTCLDDAVKSYKEMVEFYDAQNKEMDEVAMPSCKKPQSYAKCGPKIRQFRESLHKLGADLPERAETIEDVAEQIIEATRRQEKKTDDAMSILALKKLAANEITSLASPQGQSLEELFAAVFTCKEKFEEVTVTRKEQKAWLTEAYSKVSDATPDSSAYEAKDMVMRCRDRAAALDGLLARYANTVKEKENDLRTKIHDGLLAVLRTRHTLQPTMKEEELADIVASIESPVTTERLLEKYELPELQKVLKEAADRGVILSREWTLATLKDLVFPAYMVVKQTNLTTALEVKEAKSIQKLKFGHVVIQLDEPVKESVGALRMKAASPGGEEAGYVTLQGNQGTVFLKRHTGYLKAINESVLRVQKTAKKEEKDAESEKPEKPDDSEKPEKPEKPEEGEKPAEGEKCAKPDDGAKGEKEAAKKVSTDVKDYVRLKRDQVVEVIGHPTLDLVADTVSVAVRTLDRAHEGLVSVRTGDSVNFELALP